MDVLVWLEQKVQLVRLDHLEDLDQRVQLVLKDTQEVLDQLELQANQEKQEN